MHSSLGSRYLGQPHLELPSEAHGGDSKSSHVDSEMSREHTAGLPCLLGLLKEGLPGLQLQIKVFRPSVTTGPDLPHGWIDVFPGDYSASPISQ